MKTRKLNNNTHSESRWLKVEESRDNKIPIRLQPFTIYSGHVSGIQDQAIVGSQGSVPCMSSLGRQEFSL
jgi:hypothetical protein